jgi:hypothetical protein
MKTNWLPPETFSTACAALPLVSLDLCLTEPLLQRVVLMGAWEHFYPDSAFDPAVSVW